MKLGDSMVRLGARMKSGFCQQRGIVLKVINLTHEPISYSMDLTDAEWASC